MNVYVQIHKVLYILLCVCVHIHDCVCMSFCINGYIHANIYTVCTCVYSTYDCMQGLIGGYVHMVHVLLCM